jgi:nucleotide-binding universal stress UspA family protein
MKSILVPVFGDPGLESRLQAALAISRQFGAHLTCLQTFPDAGFAVGGFGEVAVYYTRLVDEIEQTQRTERGALDARLTKEDVSWSWVQFGMDPAHALTSQGRLNDLIVLSNVAGVSLPPGPEPADVVLRAPVPSLVVPQDAAPLDPAAPVMIAWNGSPEVAAAVRGALPLLKGAPVFLVEAGDPDRDYPAEAAAAYLSRHDSHATVQSVGSQDEIAETLLVTARGLGAGLIVMGAYGHTRLREAMLGGATRDMLDRSPVPLLMAH